jgi:hypothetical protein
MKPKEVVPLRKANIGMNNGTMEQVKQGIIPRMFHQKNPVNRRF